MKIYNSLTGKKEILETLEPNRVKMYVCGMTVYDHTHIGHARTFLCFDVIVRYLRHAGFTVDYIRNVTDVDDKTIRQSQEQGVNLDDFTGKWTAKFHKDCDFLNLLTPHAEPSAVEHIPEQISLIESLIERGNAYRANDGSVYFKVDAFPEYGRLSRLADREITTSATDRETSDEYERDTAADFVL